MGNSLPPAPARRTSIATVRARLYARALSLSWQLAGMAMFLALLALAGWVFHLPILAQIDPRLPAMVPNTAIGLVLGAASALALRGAASRRKRLPAGALAVIVALLGLATGLEYATGLDLGLDHIFAHAPPTSQNIYPGRPAPQTAVNFVLLGGALLLYALPLRSMYWAQAIAMLMSANALLSLTGYIFGSPALYGLQPQGILGIAVPTALSFIFLGIALLCGRPDEGVMTLMTSETESAAIARRLVLTVALGPPLAGFLTRIGVIMGWHDVEVQASLFTALLVVVLLWQTWLVARHGERAEREVRAAQERLQTLVDLAHDGIFVADIDGRYTDVNDAGCRMLGYTRGDIIGRTITDLIPEEDAPRLARARERLLRKEGGETEEWRLKKKDGSYLPVEVSAIIMPDGRWQGFARDISERKRLEREQRFLAEVSEALVATLEYREILKNLAEIVARHIADVCIIDIAGEAKPERLTVSCHDPALAEACAVLQQADMGAAARRLSSGIFHARELSFIRDFGAEDLSACAQSARHLAALRAIAPRSLIGLPLETRGAFLGAIMLLSSSRRYDEADLALAREFARRVTMAIENALLYRETQAAVKSRENLLAIVSHDLRNPLSAIAGATELLRKKATPERVAAMTDTIGQAAGQMRRLIGDLLDFARIESHTLSVEKHPVAPLDVIAPAVEVMTFPARERGIALDTDVPAGLPAMGCDAERIAQVLSNLLGNAIKFTPPQGHVHVTARAEGGEMVISISDSGPGIAPADLPKIFDPYWQADKTKKLGAGLGLAIARGLVSAHGGRIWAESAPGSGSTFRFTVPLTAATDAQTPAAHIPPSTEGSGPPAVR